MGRWSRLIAGGVLSAALIACTNASADNLEAILDDFETHEMKWSPDRAARAEGTLARSWRDVTPEGLEAKAESEAALLERLAELEIDDSNEDDALNVAVLSTILEARVSLSALDGARVPFTGDSGFNSEPLFAVSRARIKNVEDARALIARIEAIPAWFGDHIDNMKRGIDDGYTAHIDPLATTMAQIKEQLVETPEESRLFAPFQNLPNSIPEEMKETLQSEAKVAIEKAVTAYGDLDRFMSLDYKPKARSQPGILAVPGGRAAYDVLLGFHTTRSGITAEEVHQVGLDEVARIRGEMNDIIEEVGFEGSFSEFLQFLRTDEGFYAKTPAELMERAARLSKDLDAQMPAFFSKLPRLPYGVEPVPAEIAPGYTTGRYVQGDANLGRAGTYWVNTYALDQRPFYELPALTAHEAVPGHHQQIALAQELSNAPEFRRQYYATAFGEGWGLYSETLAGEMGLYKTPYERFGKLSYEMWRACRLVADTGLHAFGWERKKAEACFIENSALSPLNIQTEVTRYIGWPGQATAYKIGELTILSLRAEAEAELGGSFDIRRFHDVILEKGAVPLSVLEQRVRDWIESEKP